MIEFPNAKINLGLNITEKRPDGYHNLETIFYPIHLYDSLEIICSNDNSSKYKFVQSGNIIDGDSDNNLVVRAYKLLDKQFDLPPIEIYLHKQIPSGAGLGGGSSDAAFMLKLLNNHFKLKLSDVFLEEIASALGADCAFFIRNNPVFAEGIGNVFSPIELSLKGYYMVLVKPDVFVSTADAFSKINPKHPVQSLKDIIKSPITDWKLSMYNDFEESVFGKFPPIGNIKQKLYDIGAVYASMSGSGSSVYGIFSEPITMISDDFPGSLVYNFNL